jgi:hypothetical protein
VVEEVGVREKKAFTNFDELWEILKPAKVIKEEDPNGKPWKR